MKSAILSAARSLVATAGLAGASMAEVAAAAGVGVGTLYRYFPSKTDLLGEVVRDVCAHELDIVAKVATSEHAGATQRLVAAVSVFARRALRSGRTAYAMIAEPTAAEVEAVRLEIRADLAEVFAPIVADGVASGEFPAQSPPVASTALVGAVSEVLVGPLSTWSPTTITEAGAAALVEEIVGFVVRAIAQPAPDQTVLHQTVLDQAVLDQAVLDRKARP
jgi:AcrR family transcriptional regulator